MLEGFEPYLFSKGELAMTLTKTGGIGFSAAAVRILQQYEHVEILINYDKKMLAAHGTSDEKNSVFSHKKIRRILNKNLIDTVKNLAGKEFTDSITCYRFKGKYLSAEKAIIFDLNKPLIEKVK